MYADPFAYSGESAMEASLAPNLAPQLSHIVTPSVPALCEEIGVRGEGCRLSSHWPSFGERTALESAHHRLPAQAQCAMYIHDRATARTKCDHLVVARAPAVASGELALFSDR